MNPSPSYHPPPSLVGTSPFTPSPPLSQSNLGVIGEPSARHHGIEPKGEYLLQLLQGGGRIGQHNSTGDQVGEWPSSLEELPQSLGVEDFSTWQIRDPAVAALGPSHPFHAVEAPNQLLQPNPLFIPPQYASLRGGGAWPPQQQQQHQFFPLSIDHRDFGGLHPRGPHQVGSSQFPAYPLAQSMEQATHRVDNSILDFSRRPDAPWLPPPHVRQGISDSPQNTHTWGGSMQGSVLKTPLPLPLPPPTTPPPQQFFGNGKELLQLLLGGGSQNLGPHKLQKSSVKNAQGVVIDAEDSIGEGLTGGAQVVLSRTQVHGPIGPPKRVEASQPEQYPAGGEYLLGKLWAAPNATANGSSESSRILKPGLTLGQEDRSCDISHGGIHTKESLTSLFEASEVQQQRTYDYFPEQSKPIVKKPPGFSTEQDRLSGLPLESTIFSSPVKVLPKKGDVLGGRDGALLGTWDGFQERLSDVKSEHPLRPTDDKAFQQIQRHSTSLNGPGRNRDESYQAMSITAVKDNMATTEFSGASKENETSISRENVRLGGRGSGRRGASGRGEIGRSGGRMVTGQWVAVQDVQRERDSARDAITTRTVLDMVDVPPDRGASYQMKMNSTGSVSTPLAGKSPPPRKEDSPTSLKDAGSGGKSKEDSKRRRGQTQEWRMKQPSPPQSKSSETLATLDSPSQQHMHSAGILPLASQVDHPGLPSNMVQHSVPGSAMDESKQELHHRLHEGVRNGGRERSGRCSIDVQGIARPAWEEALSREEEEDFIREFSYAKLLDESDQLSVTPPHHTSLAARVAREEADSEGRHEHLRDSREVRRPHQHQRTIPLSGMRDVQRLDVAAFTPQLLTIYKGLIPSHEEVQKRRKFLGHLDSLVSCDWAGAKLFLFGSCANDFGVCNSDIDICLSVDDEQSTKAELVMKMAGILRSANMQNVQALTHARVPIVKFTDPDSGINCDICVNNILAVVNSKLLHDYSQVDPRLRQLAFLVKHWAKQRQVNETYRGTLSSYAYVLMCIHFLQQRKPPILPCLQDMPPTYQVIVGKIKCAYYDKVEELKDFGAGNKEPVGELLTAFFDYWAFRHDYNHCVISIRTGGYLSKDEKDWTRRIGNERHLICIEDPFEVAHDLGRVVDRHSIRVLRDEFSRAARILRQDSNPATTLFEPFIREKVQ